LISSMIQMKNTASQKNVYSTCPTPHSVPTTEILQFWV
jgi:hypothetical protein